MKKIDRKEYEQLDEGILGAITSFAKKLLQKALGKNKLIADFNFDIPDAYHTSEGDLVGYYAFTTSGDTLRLNYAIDGESEDLFSIDLIPDGKPLDSPEYTIYFEPDATSKDINNAITELLSGNFTEGALTLYAKELALLERKSPAKTAVYNWIEDEEFYDSRMDIIQDEKLSRVYAEYVRTVEGRPVSQASFINYVKEYLASNGLKNAWTRGPYRIASGEKQKSIETPEQKQQVIELENAEETLFSWRDSFNDVGFNFDFLANVPDYSPYGMILYGNGGTGKSYEITKRVGKYKNHIERGALNTKRLVRILYDYRDYDFIVFDDADSVVTNSNSANILKAACDDTLRNSNNGLAVISVPAKSGELRDIETETYVTDDGVDYEGFEFGASIIIITNLNSIKDKALTTRFMPVPIFMTKQEILEKILDTFDYKALGVSDASARSVANTMITLFENEDLNIEDHQASYRFFRTACMVRERNPDWLGWTLRALGIGVKTSYKQLKKAASTQRTKKPIFENTIIVPSDITLNFEDREIILEKGDTIKVLS